MRNKSCCFTGHRNVKNPAALQEQLKAVITDLVENEGVTDFYCGGAIGWDTISELAVVKVKFRHPHIRLHLVLPCCNEDQTEKWNQSDKNTFQLLLSKADTVEYLADRYYDGCMKKRNQRLVDMADFCVCYYNTGHAYSGTGQTVRFAEKKGIKIINLFS